LIPSIFGFEPKEQPIVTIKSPNPPRGGTCLEIIPLPIQFFVIHVQVIIIVITIVEPIEGSAKSVRDRAEHVDFSLSIIHIRIKPQEFLFTTLPLAPP